MPVPYQHDQQKECELMFYATTEGKDREGRGGQGGKREMSTYSTGHLQVTSLHDLEVPHRVLVLEFTGDDLHPHTCARTEQISRWSSTVQGSEEREQERGRKAAYVGEDLELGMTMGTEALIGLDSIFVDYAKGRKVVELWDGRKSERKGRKEGRRVGGKMKGRGKTGWISWSGQVPCWSQGQGGREREGRGRRTTTLVVGKGKGVERLQPAMIGSPSLLGRAFDSEQGS
jgi:hypothetical protein